MGSTNYADLVFKTNNIARVTFTKDGDVVMTGGLQAGSITANKVTVNNKLVALLVKRTPTTAEI